MFFTNLRGGENTLLPKVEKGEEGGGLQERVKPQVTRSLWCFPFRC